MYNVFRKSALVLLGTLVLCAAKLQAQENWQELKLSSFHTLEAGKHILVHPKFFVAGAEAEPIIRMEDVHTALHIATEPKGTYIYTFLAADNPMKWAFKVLDDTHAEWYELSCDCNVGLESSIFSNNRNPYNKLIATLTLNKEGQIEVSYADNFRKDFLSKAAFSNEFFLDAYRVYQQKK